jgi:hypothetical protein
MDDTHARAHTHTQTFLENYYNVTTAVFRGNHLAQSSYHLEQHTVTHTLLTCKCQTSLSIVLAPTDHEAERGIGLTAT